MTGADKSTANGEAPGLVWHFGPCELDEVSQVLRVGGNPQDLERKPLEVLRHLLRHAGEVVTKDELQNAVWPGRVLSDTVLTKAVSRIREVLGDDAQQIIKTVHGYGYRLVAAIRVKQASAQPVAVLGLNAGESPPQRPQWKLIGHLSSGGSGEVWRVEHAKTGEIRVLKFALDAEALTALKREITLYRLLHSQLPVPAPLAAILDWNLEEAPYFIESTFYPLGNLADWIKGRGWADVPREERLALFVRIADAVAQVHAVGVLHKDLKPGNVLMHALAPDKVMPLLADFGSAGVMDANLLREAGITRMGFTKILNNASSATPLYAAPELLSGQPHTIQSDVYALGVMLYQLVAGDFGKPMAMGWERDVDDELLREDIAAAAQGAPDARLTSAGELATRVRQLDTRHKALQQERLAAGEQLRLQMAAAKTARENIRLRARRGWLLAILGVFAIGLAFTLLFAWQAHKAELRASQAAASAQAVTGFLTDDLLGAMDVGKLQGRDVNMPQVLDYAASRVNARFGNDLAGRAQAWVALMAAYRKFPTKPRAELVPLWKQHYQVLMEYLAKDPDAAYKLAYKVVQDQPEADYLAQHQKLVEALRDYGNKSPKISPAMRLQVNLLYASLLMQAGNWNEAVADYARLQAQIDASDDAVLADGPWALVATVRDAAMLQQFDAAKRGCNRLRNYATKHVKELTIVNQVDLVFACGAYANYAGDFDLLLKLTEEGQRIAGPRFAEESGEMQTFEGWRGAALTGIGRLDEALATLNRNVASRERTKSGIYLAGSLLLRSWCLERMGRFDEALTDARQASEILRDYPQSARLITSQASYARLLARAGKVEEAKAALAVLTPGLLAQMPPQHRNLALVERARGTIARAEGDTVAAQMHFANAQTWLAAAFGPGHVWTQEVQADALRKVLR